MITGGTVDSIGLGLTFNGGSNVLNNVTLIGFLDPERYRAAVTQADAVLTLTTEPTSAGLTFDSTDDPTGGLYNQLGTKYLLGTINYNQYQVPGGYTPFNLTNLNPAGVAILAADISAGTPFTLAVTPGDSTVAATWVGDANSDSESPILRVDYATTLPAWVSPSSAAT